MFLFISLVYVPIFVTFYDRLGVFGQMIPMHGYIARYGGYNSIYCFIYDNWTLGINPLYIPSQTQ